MMSARLAAIKAALAHDSEDTVRVFRVDRLDGITRIRTPSAWCGLPPPQGDTEWYRWEHGAEACDKKRREWGDWKCAANADTADKWWPGDELDSYIESREYAASILEVPKDAAMWCGTQYIYNPSAARRVMEIR